MEGKVSGKRAETLRERFAEYGCADRFDLVEIIDSLHVSIKCKSCGSVFTRHTAFLNPSKDHNVGCNKCGIHANGSFTHPRSDVKRKLDEKAVVDYYSKGFSIQQTAAKFNVNARRVAKMVDKADARRKPGEMSVEQQRKESARRARRARDVQPADKRARAIKDRFHERGCDSHFEIAKILNRTHIVIRCLECGREFKRETSFIDVKDFNSNIGCPGCGIHVDGTYSHAREIKKEVDVDAIIEYYARGFTMTETANEFGVPRGRVSTILDNAGIAKRPKDKAEATQKEYAHELTGDPFLDEEFICAWCGREFTRHDYMVFENRKNRLLKDPDYCSSRCSRLANNERTRRMGKDANKKARKRFRKESIRKIPLGDLMERDQGICQICGGVVDLHDILVTEDGSTHTGSKYPTMDHINPTSRGGKTEWDNVQLAHKGCNSRKSTSTMEEYRRATDNT